MYLRQNYLIVLDIHRPEAQTVVDLGSWMNTSFYIVASALPCITSSLSKIIRICVDLGRKLRQIQKHADISVPSISVSADYSLVTRCYLRHIILTGTDFAREALQRCCVILTYCWASGLHQAAVKFVIVRSAHSIELSSSLLPRLA